LRKEEDRAKNKCAADWEQDQLREDKERTEQGKKKNREKTKSAVG
jgi:hypothetical protein